eukprot:COSAG06_NODE_26134_length_620_cov_24.011516_1_plen_95_part_00
MRFILSLALRLPVCSSRRKTASEKAATRGEHTLYCASVLRAADRLCCGAGRLMLGGASIGCLFKEVKPDQARECVDRAIEKGIRYVRTPTRQPI